MLAALYLSQLDERMAATGLVYVRFMDDWVVLAPTRWKLRAAVQIVNRTLDELKVEQHPDKTYIGRSSHGFDFLGYHLTLDGIRPAAQTLHNCLQRIAQLYEQGADTTRIGQSVRNWLRWLGSGLGERLVGWGSLVLDDRSIGMRTPEHLSPGGAARPEICRSFL